MNNTFEQLLNYLRSVTEYKWHLLLVTALLCAMGWTLVLLMPDRYESTAKLHMAFNESMMRPLLEGLAAKTEMTSAMASIMRKTLLSRPSLERVIQESDLDLEISTPQQKEVMFKRLTEKIQLSSIEEKGIYTITYTDHDSQRAKDVVQVLMTIFVETALGATRLDTEVTQRFLSDEITEYETKLEVAEERLKEFKRKNVGLMPSEGKTYYDQLNDQALLLKQARLELQESLDRRNELNRQISNIQPWVIDTKNNNVAGYSGSVKARIRILEDKLKDLRSKYTDDHPDVIKSLRSLKLLKKQDKTADSSDSSQGLSINPVYQEIKIQLGSTEAEVAALKVRVNAYEKSLTELRDKIDTIPKVEADLVKLNRDYDIVKEAYEGLVARRESALLSQQAGESSNDLQFKVIEAPVASVLPVGPNRLKWFTLCLLAALASGVGFAVFLFQQKSGIYSMRELRSMIDLPVLGTVSFVLSPQRQLGQRIHAVLFGIGSSALLLIYAGLLLWQLRIGLA